MSLCAQGCGVQAESDVTLVYSADGTSLGEAFVHFSGPQARLRLGLSRDATVMPVRGMSERVGCRMCMSRHQEVP